MEEAAGAPVAETDSARERWTWHHPALVGNAVRDAQGDVVAAVQRSYDWPVYLSQKLDPAQRAAMAAIRAGAAHPRQASTSIVAATCVASDSGPLTAAGTQGERQNRPDPATHSQENTCSAADVQRAPLT